MIYFEIDGEEYVVELSAEEIPSSIQFTTPEGATYWMGTPKVAA